MKVKIWARTTYYEVYEVEVRPGEDPSEVFALKGGKLLERGNQFDQYFGSIGKNDSYHRNRYGHTNYPHKSFIK